MKQVDLHSFLNDATTLPRTTTLVREEGLRTLLLHLKAGEQIPEHQTRGAIIVQCLAGHVSFASDDRVDLTPGLLVSLEPGTPHSLNAQEDTLLLVTISEDLATTSLPR